MALGFYFKPQSFTKERYDEAVRRLEEAGAGSPPGRAYHFAWFGQEGGIEVFDVWASQESFDEFGKTLMPILQEAGVDAGQPHVEEVHNTIIG